MNSHAAQIRSILDNLGVPHLQVIADPGDIAAREQQPGTTVTFAAALRAALEAFLHDDRGSGQGSDTARAVVRSAPESFGLTADPSNEACVAALTHVLTDDPKAEVVLLGVATIIKPNYRFLPEYGEDIEEHWVFRIIAPASWPFLQWSIVDCRGDVPPYSYMFD
jgi:hypothetical protein